MQGKSLWPILKGQNDLHEHREDVYCEFYHSSVHHKDPVAHATMICNENYKLIAYHGVQEGELYDLKKDPQERVNCWSIKEYDSVKLALLQRLCDRMAETVDPLPLREANF
jgi:arylsulfatase